MGGLDGVVSLIAGPAYDWSNLSLLNETAANPRRSSAILWKADADEVIE
jgi:hypothetical protein